MVISDQVCAVSALAEMTETAGSIEREDQLAAVHTCTQSSQSGDVHVMADDRVGAAHLCCLGVGLQSPEKGEGCVSVEISPAGRDRAGSHYRRGC